MWPSSYPKQKKNRFTCKYCFKKFRTSHALGGHTSKLHPGISKKFKRTLIRREERANDRYVHSLAKEILEGLYQNTLDAKTYETFKKQRNRLSKYEKAQL